MDKFFRTMVEEKGMLEQPIEVEDNMGITHFMTVENVIEAIEQTSLEEQKKIKDIFSKIDFHNGDLLHFIKHLAQGLVNNM